MDLTQIKLLQYNKRMIELDQLINTPLEINVPKFDKKDIIAYACVAYRISKDNLDETPPNHPRLFSAYHIIKTMAGADNPAPIDPQYLAVTDQDKNLCWKVLNWLPKLTFKGLDDNASNFQKKCYEISCQDQVTESDFSAIAFFPKMYLDNESKSRNISVGKTTDSGFIGVPGAPITVQLLIVNKKFLDKFGSYVYTAISGCNHFCSFFSKNAKYEEGSRYTVTGKVKLHTQYYYDKSIDETQLHFIKEKHDTLRASYNKPRNP